MKPRRQDWIAWAIACVAALAVSTLRAPLFEAFAHAKDKDDVYALPPSRQVVLMSLGYRSALADLVFAHVLVSSGIHVQERRPFEFVAKYLETVIELDPKFMAPYRMADGLITLQAKAVPPQAYRDTRRILERGMKEFPYDQALWSSAGQFLAYLAATGLTDRKEIDEWKLAGGRTLARACELVGTNDDVPSQCIAAAGLLTKAGAGEAHRQQFQRVLATTDDPKVRAFYSALLKQMSGGDDPSLTQAHREAFQQAQRGDLPFVSRGALLAIGPSWDPAACAGSNTECATSWRAWGVQQARAPGALSAQ